MEVRSSELETRLSSNDKAIEADTVVSAPSSLNPSSSFHTVHMAFHALKEEHSLDKDTQDRFQIPNETRILLPRSGKKACSFTTGEVYFYEAAFLAKWP